MVGFDCDNGAVGRFSFHNLRPLQGFFSTPSGLFLVLWVVGFGMMFLWQSNSVNELRFFRRVLPVMTAPRLRPMLNDVNRADVHTVVAYSRLDAIRTVYGVFVARDLMNITTSDDNPARSIFKMDDFISNANYVVKKTTMILFINDWLVECTALKRAIEVVYSATLPKASRPFIYMSISLPSEHVDVNIHPTKGEVSLLNQESLIETIQTAVESKLINSNTSRTF